LLQSWHFLSWRKPRAFLAVSNGALEKANGQQVRWAPWSVASSAVMGGVNGVLGVDQRPRFHSYAVERHHPSYEYQGDFRVGTVLPEAGVTYYDVPEEYSAQGYRYTVVNGRAVLVEPRTRRVVEIVE